MCVFVGDRVFELRIVPQQHRGSAIVPEQFGCAANIFAQHQDLERAARVCDDFGSESDSGEGGQLELAAIEFSDN